MSAPSILQATPSDAPALPRHIAIIMDGNGRWAKKHGKLRAQGHQAGAEALRGVLEACKTRPYIQYLTVYAFSQENWKRDPSEVEDLMNLLRFYIKREAKNIVKEGVRLRIIGNRQALSADLQRDILEIEHASAANDRITVQMALSYGSRQEMVMAAQSLATRAAKGEINPDDIDESMMTDALYTSGVPDPDLLIRTGGDERLSNFLLWQGAYTELVFSDVLWPDFTATELDKAIEIYSQRERRFGARAAHE